MAALMWYLTQSYLVGLRNVANKACKLAVEKKTEIKGPVNWADLSCHEARYWCDDSGGYGYTVLIEEASPEAVDLMLFIGEEVRKSGYNDVYVQLDW